MAYKINSTKCIVVPIYKQFVDLNKNEIKSIFQLFKILRKHPIYFIGPKNLDWNKYISEAKLKGVYINVKNFSSPYFSSVKGYNNLLTSKTLYKAFSNYKYMLIYQLDAFVFKDELNFWCNKGYDYIGAPWFEGWDDGDVSKEILGIGNGGFSLRNIHTSITVLKRIAVLKSLRSFWFFSRLQSLWRFEKIIVKFAKFLHIKYPKKLNTIIFDTPINEDFWWSHIGGSFFTDYKVAPNKEAYAFSFEVNAAYLFNLNNGKLPFGCHAWEKYDTEFWAQHIVIN